MLNFDCHAHVYENTAALPNSRYTPKSPAPLDDWLAQLERHGLAGGVIVQVSFLGTDNSQLCAALSKLDRKRFAGVAVVDTAVPNGELDRLWGLGVRGVRWNLVRGARMPDLDSNLVQAHLTAIRERGLHLELHLESDRLTAVLPQLLDTGTRLVIDHFGLPTSPDADQEPWLNCVARIPDRSQIFVKLSAPYRTGFDVSGHASRIRSLFSSDQIIWGSDWPHTQHEDTYDFDRSVSAARDFPSLGALNAVKRLYGIS